MRPALAGYSDIPADAVTAVSTTQITCQFDLTTAADQDESAERNKGIVKLSINREQRNRRSGWYQT